MVLTMSLSLKKIYFEKIINSRLGQLYKELIAEKYNVSFVIVNAHDSGNMDVFLKTNLTVLQDNSKINVWGMYNAKVDDMIIFDR